MRKTRARAKKRERERSRGEDFALAKSRTTHALNALLLSLRGDFWFFEEEGESKNKFFIFFSLLSPDFGLNWSYSRRLPH